MSRGETSGRRDTPSRVFPRAQLTTAILITGEGEAYISSQESSGRAARSEPAVRHLTQLGYSREMNLLLTSSGPAYSYEARTIGANP